MLTRHVSCVHNKNLGFFNILRHHTIKNTIICSHVLVLLSLTFFLSFPTDVYHLIDSNLAMILLYFWF